MNGAGTTQAHAAAKLGAVVTGHVANCPEQGHVLGDIELMVLTVEFQGNHGHARIVLGYGVEQSAAFTKRFGHRRSTQANGLSCADGKVCTGPLVEQMNGIVSSLS